MSKYKEGEYVYAAGFVWRFRRYAGERRATIQEAIEYETEEVEAGLRWLNRYAHYAHWADNAEVMLRTGYHQRQIDLLKSFSKQAGKRRR
jgi:hypothetical protein